jgi:hypothetical protein
MMLFSDETCGTSWLVNGRANFTNLPTRADVKAAKLKSANQGDCGFCCFASWPDCCCRYSASKVPRLIWNPGATVTGANERLPVELRADNLL